MTTSSPSSRIDYTFIDLDGTLRLPPGEFLEGYLHHVHVPVFAEFVERSKRGEIRMGLCTGRELPYVEGFGEPWGHWDIVEGGVLTCNRTTGVRYYHPAITPEGRQLFQLLSREVFPRILSNIPDLYLYQGGKEINIAIQSIRRNVPIQSYVPEVERRLDEYSQQAGGLLEKLEEKIESDYSNLALDYRISGVNKGTAFERFCEREEIDRQRVLSIIDSRGDFSIAEKAGYAACPLNASPECKEFVHSRGERGHVSDYPFMEGVIDSLRYFQI